MTAQESGMNIARYIFWGDIFRQQSVPFFVTLAQKSQAEATPEQK
jgi:hypothetical protein